MVVACGAEARISTKYGRFVDEAKKHAQSVGPLIATQFGLIVCPSTSLLRARQSSPSNMTTHISFLAVMLLLVWRFGTAPSF